MVRKEKGRAPFARSRAPSSLRPFAVDVVRSEGEGGIALKRRRDARSLARSAAAKANAEPNEAALSLISRDEEFLREELTEADLILTP